MTPEPVAPATLLIFDGDCGFCTTAVGWGERHFAFWPDASPWQWTDLDAYGLTPADGQARVWFVVNGQRFGGGAALTALLRSQPSPVLRSLGRLGTIAPLAWVIERGYRLVARYRYNLPGGTPACKMPKST